MSWFEFVVSVIFVSLSTPHLRDCLLHPDVCHPGPIIPTSLEYILCVPPALFVSLSVPFSPSLFLCLCLWSPRGVCLSFDSLCCPVFPFFFNFVMLLSLGCLPVLLSAFLPALGCCFFFFGILVIFDLSLLPCMRVYSWNLTVKWLSRWHAWADFVAKQVEYVDREDRTFCERHSICFPNNVEHTCSRGRSGKHRRMLTWVEVSYYKTKCEEIRSREILVGDNCNKSVV